jgi:hypothetical protein
MSSVTQKDPETPIADGEQRDQKMVHISPRLNVLVMINIPYFTPYSRPMLTLVYSISRVDFGVAKNFTIMYL